MISMTSSSASRCDPVWPSWSFRSSSISIMCRRKQRPPSRKRPLSWGRRPKRSLDSLKNRWERPRSGGSLYMEPRKAPRKSVDPYEHGHIWRIISHSQTSPTHFVANASHMISHNLSHMISNIMSQTTSQLYPYGVFSDHIFRRARMLFAILLFIPDYIPSVFGHFGVQSPK